LHTPAQRLRAQNLKLARALKRRKAYIYGQQKLKTFHLNDNLQKTKSIKIFGMNSLVNNKLNL
jgi:hypothetical protein